MRYLLLSLSWSLYFRLGDRSYDKRKNAAVDLTALVRTLQVKAFLDFRIYYLFTLSIISLPLALSLSLLFSVSVSLL
jgi:hypothetical protein